MIVAACRGKNVMTSITHTASSICLCLPFAELKIVVLVKRKYSAESNATVFVLIMRLY